MIRVFKIIATVINPADQRSTEKSTVLLVKAKINNTTFDSYYYCKLSGYLGGPLDRLWRTEESGIGDRLPCIDLI